MFVKFEGIDGRDINIRAEKVEAVQADKDEPWDKSWIYMAGDGAHHIKRGPGGATDDIETAVAQADQADPAELAAVKAQLERKTSNYDRVQVKYLLARDKLSIAAKALEEIFESGHSGDNSGPSAAACDALMTMDAVKPKPGGLEVLPGPEPEKEN